MGANPPEPRKPVAEARLRSFHELMQARIQRILLVSSLYDSFIMSEEGQLHETLLSHFIELNQSNIPDLVQVPGSADALELFERGRSFDLVIAGINSASSNAADLARELRALGRDVPVIGLAYTNRELHDFVSNNDTSDLERIFLWQGDVRIVLAMVTYLEDRLNADNDTGVRGVPAIILVEDSIRFYSSFLPAIYAELFKHTHGLLSEDLNLSQRMMRMRARPKVLLCDTYEEAWDYFERYEQQVLGVISDFEFRHQGRLDPRAGLELCMRVREVRPDIRIVLQSSESSNRRLAESIGASFLLKGSPVLLQQLSDILVKHFGFGDFIFRMPDKSEVDRAHDLKSLAKKIATVPAECIAYHAAHNHFANWLKARTEFALAERFAPQRVEDFESIDAMRRHLLEMLRQSQRERFRTVIADFDRSTFEPAVTITRIGAGSLGGKARGVAFGNRILRHSGVEEDFPDVDVHVPPSVVLATQIFDEFLEHWGLRDFAIAANPDARIMERFLEAPFPRTAVASLRAFLERVKYPLAVRSSSLLEDSLSQPFAGVYQTYMLANNARELDLRWLQLANAVKRVYASVFMEQAKTYLSLTSYRLEEEKMAVMVQELVGNRHGDRFYPDFAGVARSHNFYPEPGHTSEDGVVAVALGMGRAVVGGDPCLRFCPRYPQQIVSFSSVQDALDSSQRVFHALDLGRHSRDSGIGELMRFPLEVAEKDGTLKFLGSTFLPNDNRIVDGISRPGVRLVSFAQVLKHGAFPLAELLRVLLERCAEGTGAPVEIEFAGNFARPRERAQFAFLQLRPLAVSRESEDVEIGPVDPRDLVCRSERVLGNGKIDDVRDLVVIHPQRFDRRRTPEIALEVARFDAILRKEREPYLLVGPGRWGSADPNLGIPVGWNQIAGARVIIEAGLEDLRVEPSQGTHFFQNLTSCNVGYFTVNPAHDEGFVDWDWLDSLDAVEETEHVRRLRTDAPLEIKMSGRTGEGIVRKPS